MIARVADKWRERVETIAHDLDWLGACSVLERVLVGALCVAAAAAWLAVLLASLYLKGQR